MKYPKHVALIPDGNRTWAKEKGLPKLIGHTEGLGRITEISEYIFTKTDIQVFTAWGLSTENWHKREDSELEYLFDLFEQVPTRLYDLLKTHKVNFRWIGKTDGLPANLVELLNKKQQEMSYDTDRTLVLAINYGGRDEIIRGIKEAKNKEENFEEYIDNLDEKSFGKYMDLGDLPDVEFVIRTKGDVAKRLSGFMLWWIGYAEFYFTGLKCPAFTVEEFKKALEHFDSIYGDRNFGK